jgi:hypothetical protein
MLLQYDLFIFRCFFSDLLHQKKKKNVKIDTELEGEGVSKSTLPKLTNCIKRKTKPLGSTTVIY